jgi:purine-nucleoside phosphorylase
MLEPLFLARRFGLVVSAKQFKSKQAAYGFEQADKAAKLILSKTRLRPRIGVVLGSGLGAFADELTGSVRLKYSEIPNFAVSTAVGHAGELVIGRLGEVPVAVMKGRVHLYEGYSAQQVAFPVRVLGCLGVKTLIATNAAGGINLDYGQGKLVLIRDHINLQGKNPLVGENDERWGPRFPDMTDAYSKQLRELARSAAKKLKLEISEGVYAALKGPSYETPAEIRYLRTIGADLVGMSTVPEVIAARHMGMRVLAISCVTNMAAGILDKPINHEEVLEVTGRVQSQFLALLRAVIPAIAKE